MRITSLVENTSRRGLPVEHGLSLYIELDNGKNVLFDMGQSHLFVQNAEQMGLSIAEVDYAIISHGHYDHGGGLRTFLKINDKAKIFLQKRAFEPHFSLRSTGLHYIGIDSYLANNARYLLCDNQLHIEDSLFLFAGVTGGVCWPHGNRLLFGPSAEKNDDFCHEQNLIIKEGPTIVLCAGCAHNGIVNIMRKAEMLLGTQPTHVFAGMHLVKSNLDEVDDNQLIETLTYELKKYNNTKFYTMHCTGEEAFKRMHLLMGEQIEYLSCGEQITI